MSRAQTQVSLINFRSIIFYALDIMEKTRNRNDSISEYMQLYHLCNWVLSLSIETIMVALNKSISQYILNKKLFNGYKIKSLECTCHRCNYRWQYRGNSKYIACCPRCKMTVYIPKVLRLLREAQSKAKSGDQYVEQIDKKTLDARVLNSMTSSWSKPVDDDNVE
jgi:PHP family Zn ribbon phosphoesterase